MTASNSVSNPMPNNSTSTLEIPLEAGPAVAQESKPVNKPISNRIIYHILPATTWHSHPAGQPYEGDTLAREGFIHCTGKLDLLVEVANRHFRKTPGDFLVLCIAESKVQAEVKWEEADGHRYPHIYGPLNLDAVLKLVRFPRKKDGQFTVPTDALRR